MTQVNKIIFILMILSLSVFSYNITTFNDSTTSKNWGFTSSYLSNESYINLPKNALITTATLKTNVTYNWINHDATCSEVGMTIYNSKVVVDSNLIQRFVFTGEHTADQITSYLVVAVNSTNVSSDSCNPVGFIGNSFNNQSFDIGIDSNNVVYAVFVYYNPTDDNQYLYVTNSTVWSGGSQVPKQLINSSIVNKSTSGGLDLANPAIAIDSNNVVHVAWEMYNGSSYQIYYANSSSNWNVIQISNESSDCHSPDILVDDNGVVQVVYQDPVAGNYGKVSMSGGDGGSTNTCSFQGYPDTYIKYTNSSIWPNSTTIVSAIITPCNLREPEIAQDSDGNLYLTAWYNYGDNPIFYQPLWNSSTKTDVGYGYYPQIQIDSENVKHFVYINTTNLNITFTNSSSSFTPIYKPAPSGYIGSAIGPNGGLFMTAPSSSYLCYMRYGDLPNTTSVYFSGSDDYFFVSQTIEYKGAKTNNFKNNLTTELSTCTPINNNCTFTIGADVGSAGRVILSDLNISYGTQLTGAAAGLTFKLSNGSDVTTSPVYENSNVSVYNGSTLVAIIPIDFSQQPNYTGWSAEAGVNSTDNRAYVITSPLTDASNPQASSKTLYLKFSNTSASKVCVNNSSSITATALKAIVTENDCTTAGGTITTANTTEIGGVTYFELKGLTHSGAVQVINSTSGDNPPILTDASVSPSSGTADTTFVFTVTVYDDDNDAQTVTVTIDGVSYVMDESNSSDTTTSDGKQYTYSTQLSQATHSYYFTSDDGTGNTASTITYSLVIGSGTPIIVSAPGFNYLAVLVLFLSVSLIYYKLN